MPIKDSLIAATALVHDFTVVTRNTHDFRNARVKVLDPSRVTATGLYVGEGFDDSGLDTPFPGAARLPEGDLRLGAWAARALIG